MSKIAKFFTEWQAAVTIVCAIVLSIVGGAAGHAIAMRDISNLQSDVVELKKDHDTVEATKNAIPIIREDIRYMRDRIDKIADRMGINKPDNAKAVVNTN